MNSKKDFRGEAGFPDTEEARKATKLPPIKKSGKERYELYSELDDVDEEINLIPKKESVFDYFDHGQEEDL